MSFTQEDCRKEILLKVMLAEAWADGNRPTEEDRQVLEDWITSLSMEGPECGRVRKLLETPVDEFQAELYSSELKATVHAMGADERDMITQTLERMLTRRKHVYPLERKLAERVHDLIDDRSGIEQLLNRVSPQ